MDLTKDLSKKINDLVGTEMGRSADTSEFLKSMSNVTSQLGEKEEKIIKKSIKKGTIVNKSLSKKTPAMKTPIGKIFSAGKSETKEATSSGGAGGFEAPLFSKEMKEKWSKEYKDSINCDNPKGFSQRAHCAGKKKKSESKKTETKEATGSGSAGAYVTTAAWAKSTNKKDWAGKGKGPTYKGGKFVTVKKECKTFPYCNQGDINALKLTTEGKINQIILEISQKYNVSEDYVKKLILKDLHKNKR